MLWLLTRRCGALEAESPSRCDRVAMAERWTVADTQNQAAWLTLVDALEVRGRHAEARAALVRGAQASTWREDQFALGQLLLAAVPSDGMTPRQRLWVMERARMIGFEHIGPLPALRQPCKDITLRDVCLRYLDTIARDADNLMALRVVAVYSGRVGAPDDVVTARARKADAYFYAMTAMSRGEDDADLDVALRGFRERAAGSEAARAARYLADGHITIDEGARRYTAGLTAEQQQFQAARLRPWSADERGS